MKNEIDFKEKVDRILQDIADTKNALVEKLMQEALMDEDGYPTEAALQIVENWHWADVKGWFDFIKSIWHLESWGWHEGEADHEYRNNVKVYRYNLSTAGWSGNESIIQAMKKCDNGMMWYMYWVSSRRGGHYVFEIELGN